MPISTFLLANIVSMLCIVAAFALALKERPGWPLFLLAALCFFVSASTLQKVGVAGSEEQEASASVAQKPAG